MQGNQRYVYSAYLIFGVLLATTLAKILNAVAFSLGISDPPMLGSQFTASTLIGIAVALVGGIILLRNRSASDFSHEVVGELRKVTWPSRAETQRSTIVVIVTTLIVSLMLGLFDFAWAKLTGLIYA
ncbi:MAG: preprotein translocase subunit SecE [Myxococcota bacterium]